MRNLLVTGATGGLGSKVVEFLAASGNASRLAVAVRDLAKAEGMRSKGIEIRQADYEDPASLEKAFKGIERLLLISTMGDNETRIRQHLNAVDAAKKAGVGFIAYTSVAKADTTTLWLAEVHRVTERAIRESGIPFAFLRNNWYLENEGDTIKAVLAGAPLATSAGDGRVSWAPRADYAKAAAAVLTGKGHENEVYELSGPSATYADLAAALSKAAGRNVQVQRLDDAAFAKRLAEAGLPGFAVDIVVNIHAAIRGGALGTESGDFEALLGRRVTPLNEAVEAFVEGLKAAA
jgi:NAD(P)H dehydrogenase (quinone)